MKPPPSVRRVRRERDLCERCSTARVRDRRGAHLEVESFGHFPAFYRLFSRDNLFYLSRGAKSPAIALVALQVVTDGDSSHQVVALEVGGSSPLAHPL